MKVLGQGRGAARKPQRGMAATVGGKRDRHGRVVGDAVSAEQIALLIDLAPAFEALNKIARRVFKDRNAAGVTDETGFIDKYRPATRAAVRPVLRRALARAALARTAILRADRPTFDLQLACAQGLLASVGTLFRQPAVDTMKQGLEEQARKAKLPRTTISVDGQRMRKNELVAMALQEAGIDANTSEVWPHLFSVLEHQRMSPQEMGAKDTRRITASDDDGKEVEFSFKGVQAALRKMRDRPVKKGRPKKIKPS